jgi:hypothetical protein
VADFERTGDVPMVVERSWTGTQYLTDIYFCINDLPLRDGNDPRHVGGYELTTTTAEGQVLYRNAWASIGMKWDNDRLRYCLLFLPFLLPGIWPIGSRAAEVTVYSTYGYRSGGEWVIPMRVWVHEPRPITEATLRRLVAGLTNRPAPELARLGDRLSDLVADDESRERVAFQFDQDPAGATFMLRGTNGLPLRSDLNGLVLGELRLSTRRARGLLQAQGSRLGWLRLHVVSQGHQGGGSLRLIEPQGRSVISDIDDTIKVTRIPAGTEVVMENTFFRPFQTVPGMAERYRDFGPETAFHYVSGGPWQMYRPLAAFLDAAGFPAGSFHMKSVRKNLFTAGSWRDLARLAEGDATTAQKLTQISGIIAHFPGRHFILFGDSGEHDPEVYDALRRRFPTQIESIWIRDLKDARDQRPGRFAGMHLIEAQ